MWTKTVLFCSLLLTAILLGAGLAHLFALPNKVSLSASDYLTVQQVYRGWDLLGFAYGGALAATAVLMLRVRQHPYVLASTVVALVALTGSLAVFFAFTYPANLATENWTFLPGNWQELRLQWEYAHAAGAYLDLTAFVCLLVVALAGPRGEARRGHAREETPATAREPVHHA